MANPMETLSARGAGWDEDSQARLCSIIPCPPNTNIGPKVSVEEADWVGTPSLALSSPFFVIIDLNLQHA